MDFLQNNDQDGFNSYISGDEFFNQRGGTSGNSLYTPPPSPQNDCPCEYAISGCTNANANNFNANATVDDGSCTYTGFCYELGCVSPGVPMSGSTYTNLTSPGCSSLGSTYSSNPASCGSLPGGGGTGPRSFNGYSNFNQQGFGGYNDKMWFND